jgi:Xaa-Pro dipeptidase
MDYYFYNTDADSLVGPSRPRFYRLIEQHFAATGGPRRYGELLGKLKEGDALLMYENGMGIVAVGRVCERWDGKSHEDLLYYQPGDKWTQGPVREYRIEVDWTRSDDPISVWEVRKRFGYTPRSTLQLIRKQRAEAEAIVAEMQLTALAIPASLQSHQLVLEYAMSKVPITELNDRMQRFRACMDTENRNWELIAIFGRVNQYYFTGTMQDGVLLIPRDGPAVFCVRRSYERACIESLFPDIRPMKGFRDAAPVVPGTREIIHVDTEVVSLALLGRFRKYFPYKEVASMDLQALRVRAVKSPCELAIMERAGAMHRRVLEEGVPELLREGVSEAEFGCALYSLMVREGHQGVIRFGTVNVDVAVGQIGFGESSIYPTSFDGPGGSLGIGPAAPVLGSRDRRLREGDLVFVDIGFAVDGYHTDKTMVYMFGRPLPDEVTAVHRRCVEIQHHLATLIRPGAIPAEIYTSVMEGLAPEFLRNFMGLGDRRANFLGHGVGLQIDEMPVLAEGFDEPLVSGMVLALEPKKGVPGVGMVGVEDTFVIGPDGGRSITGTSPGLTLVRS